jgi:hypothetical protein
MAEWEPVRVEMRGGGDFVELDGGRRVWNRLTVVRSEVRVEIEVDTGGVAECRDVRVVSVGAGRSVRARDIRAVKLDDLIEAGFALAVWQPAVLSEQARRHGVDASDWFTGSTVDESQTEVRGLRRRRRDKNRTITDDLLREVAEVYRSNLDRGPTQAVAERFSKAPSTAALYVKLARDAGFLGAAIRGKAGEQS